MSIEAEITSIDFTIKKNSNKKLLEKLKSEYIDLDEAKTLRAYLDKIGDLEYEISDGIYRFNKLPIDSINRAAYDFLNLFAEYAVDGSFVKIQTGDGGWSVAIYDDGKFEVRGDLSGYMPKVDIEYVRIPIVKEKTEILGVSEDYDHLNEMFSPISSERNITDYRYWKYCCISIAEYVELISRLIGKLKSVNEDKTYYILQACKISRNSILGVESITKGSFNYEMGRQIDLLDSLKRDIEMLERKYA